MSKRDTILRQWQKADSSADMDKAYEIYCQILTMPGLSFHLSKDEILDIRYNRAINNIEIGNFLLGEKLYTRAHTHFQEALDDRKACAEGYSTSKAREISATALAESKEHMKTIIGILEQQSAVIPTI
jgi:hypothetical protein